MSFNSRQKSKQFFIALACLLALLVLAWGEEDWRGWHVWNHFKHEQEALGEKFDFKDFIPPPVSDQKNFAMAPLVVGSRLFDMTVDDESYWNAQYQGADLGDWRVAKTTDLARWQIYYRWLKTKTDAKQFPVPPQPQTPASDVLFALNQYDETIAELRQAAQLPDSRFPLDYDQANPAEILLPHLPALKHCAETLELHAVAELQNGESDKALADVELSLQLAEKIHNEPFVDSQLARIIILQDAIQVIYEGLAARRWTDAQLAELDSELAKLDFLADYQFSMRADEALRISETEYFRRTRDFRALDNSDYVNDYSAFYKIIFPSAPSAIFFRNELNIAQIHERWILPAVDVEKRMVFPKVIESGDDKLKSRSPCNILALMFFDSLPDSAIKFAHAQSSVDLARIAIALERYRLAHGGFPDSLNSLFPQFMKKTLRDIIDGQPLNYRRTSDGKFALYSVGWNETDNGGTVGLIPNGKNADNAKGDWVWRYPQK